jgi:hypothetical protein
MTKVGVAAALLLVIGKKFENNKLPPATLAVLIVSVVVTPDATVMAVSDPSVIPALDVTL